MFGLVQNLDIIEHACNQFIKPHETYYNFTNEIIPEVVKYHNLRLETQELTTSTIINKESIENTIKLHFISNINNSQNCIVYLHGLSSYSIEGKFLIPFLGDNLSLCVYDSRGHGLNKAQYVSYGLLQTQDLFEILKRLDERGFKNIILWGRSMGSVTCLRTIQQYKDHSAIQNVRYIVADSPFSSFKKIATDIVSKMVLLPEFISGIIADAFANKINQKYDINLKNINLEELSSKVPVMFLYSSKDEIMGKHHIEAITNNFIGQKQLCDIQVAHNQQRPNWIIVKAMNKIRQILKQKKIDRKGLQTKRRGLSITKNYSNRYLALVTPTCSHKSSQKSLKFIPIGSVDKRKTVHHKGKNESKQNRQTFKKSTVQTYNKYSSVQLKYNLVKSSVDKNNIFKNRRTVAYNDFI